MEVSPFQKRQGFNMYTYLVPGKGLRQDTCRVLVGGDVLKSNKTTSHGLMNFMVRYCIPMLVKQRMWYCRTCNNCFIVTEQPRWSLNRHTRHTKCIEEVSPFQKSRGSTCICALCQGRGFVKIPAGFWLVEMCSNQIKPPATAS